MSWTALVLYICLMSKQRDIPVSTMVSSVASVQGSQRRQDLPCTYLPHHGFESVDVVTCFVQGFCYNHQRPVVYFACEGQMQCFKQGQNPAEHVWDSSTESPAPAFLQVCTHNLLPTAGSACLLVSLCCQIHVALTFGLHILCLQRL